MKSAKSAKNDSGESRIILQTKAADHSLRTMTAVMLVFLVVISLSQWPRVVFAKESG